MRKFIAIICVLCFFVPSCYAARYKKDKALEVELEGRGYAGTLPDLTKVFQKKEQKISTPLFEAQKDFNDPSQLKPIPRDNPSFVNIIQKKDKTSHYITDANEIILLLEKLLDSIEDNSNNVQLFITRANVVSMNLDYLSEKYKDQPESSYESFRKLMEVNGYVKSISQLRREAIVYQRYLAYQESGSIYNPENINQQLEYLKDELNTAILLLKEEEK